MNQYLIPANTKQGKLILGLFTGTDLILFGTGVLVSVILLAIVPLESVANTLFGLAPALITAFLVMPIPYYHNTLTVIMELYAYMTKNQRYKWRGWCYKDGYKKKK